MGSNPTISTIDGAVMANVVYVKYWNKHLPTFKFGSVAQWQEAAVLETVQCRFESYHFYFKMYYIKNKGFSFEKFKNF